MLGGFGEALRAREDSVGNVGRRGNFRAGSLGEFFGSRARGLDGGRGLRNGLRGLLRGLCGFGLRSALAAHRPPAQGREKRNALIEETPDAQKRRGRVFRSSRKLLCRVFRAVHEYDNRAEKKEHSRERGTAEYVQKRP